MRCGVYSLRANYTQTIHEAYIERLRDKETKRQRVGEIKRLKDKESKRLRDRAYPNPSLKGRALLRR